MEVVVSNNDSSFTSSEIEELRRTLETQRIQNVFSRYVRGVDRGDEKLMRSTMWENATDDHGTFTGSGEGFVQYRLGIGKNDSRGITCVYHLTSPVHVLSLDGDEAKVETYFHLVLTASSQGLDTIQNSAGRYRDHFEKRGDEWRILRRKVIYDWCTVGTCAPGWEYANMPPANRGRLTSDDASYDPTW